MLFAVLVGLQSSAQTLTATFSAYANEEISLQTFRGFENHSVSTAIADTTGHFTISFEGVEDGMGYISVKEGKPYFIVLSGQDIVLKGGYFADPNSITCTKGKEQQAFIQYASEHTYFQIF